MKFLPLCTMRSDLKACVVCLKTVTDVKLIEIGGSEIRKWYNSMTGLQTTESDVLCNYICIVCLARTRSFHAFRNKCQRSYFILQELGKDKNIQEESLRLLDRAALGLSSTLGYSESLSFSLNTESDYYVISNYETSNNETPNFGTSNFETSDYGTSNHETSNYGTSIKEEVESQNESLPLEVNLNVFDNSQNLNNVLKIEYSNHETIKQEVTLNADQGEKKVKIVKPVKKQPKQIKKRNRKEVIKKDTKPLKKNCFRVVTKKISRKRDISKYLSCRLLTPKEQYGTVLDKKKTEKYLNANYKCEHCFQAFISESTLGNHLKKHDHELFGQLQCDYCKSCFKNKNKIRMHINQSHTYKFSCNKCKFVSLNRFVAVKHFKFHENESYGCPHCDKKFLRQTSCLSHIRKQHPSAFLCQICGNNFLTLNGLERHQKWTHTEEEVKKVSEMVLDIEGPLYCKECKIQFLSEEASYNHLYHSTKHSKPPGRKRKYTRRFPRSREFKCDVCSKSLQGGQEAELHYKQEHPEYRQFICDVCGHASKTRGFLEAHYRTHTREKPYQCEHCELRFRFATNYRRHIASVHKKIRYKCDLCTSTFSLKYAIKLHIQTVHMKLPYPPWQNYNRRRREKKAAELDARDTLE